MKNINRVVAAKFYWACKIRRNIISLTFIKVSKNGDVLFKHKLINRTNSYKLTMATAQKDGFKCAGVTEFNRAENAVLFTTCRMRITESMLNKAVKTAIGIIER